jgi:hypothetical protein
MDGGGVFHVSSALTETMIAQARPLKNERKGGPLNNLSHPPADPGRPSQSTRTHGSPWNEAETTEWYTVGATSPLMPSAMHAVSRSV